jgi:HAD superfamily hydrolase (TIGR01549 family)
MIQIYNPQRVTGVPDAVLFDTDNTLYHYDPAHSAAMMAVQKKVTTTFSIDDATFKRAFDEARHEIKERLGGTASSHSRLLYFQRMLEIIGLGSQVLLALDFEQTYWRTFLGKAVLFEGVKDLLDDLRLQGIPLAIVTDLTAQIQFRKMVYFDLDHHFDYIVTSEEAGHDKPHEAPFQLALKKMRPKGSCVWMIGDNPKTDIRSSREKIGAIAFQKIHSGVDLGVGAFAPDVSFEHFSELRALLRRKIGEREKASAGAAG